MSRLYLRPCVESGSPCEVRVECLRRPGSGLQSESNPVLHQPMPGRVEVNLVDSVAVSVVGAQDGRVDVRQASVLSGGLATGGGSESSEVVDGGLVSIPDEGRHETGIAPDGIVVRNRRRLVRG
jgi:hypothetical protein